MIRKIIVLFLLLSGSIFPVVAQQVEKINTSMLQKLVTVNDNKLHVVNFWATWCSPCVKELPGFEKLISEYPTDKVDFLFVSLDFPSSEETSLIPFIKGKMIEQKVVLMTGNNADQWIRMIDKDWQGNLPATLLYRTSDHTRVFHDGALEYAELKTMIDSHL